jgi:hypothetical protein
MSMAPTKNYLAREASIDSFLDGYDETKPSIIQFTDLGPFALTSDNASYVGMRAAGPATIPS